MRQAPSSRRELQRAQQGAPEPRKRSGAYYTPDAVAAMLGRWAVRSASDRVLDPACGDGRFLTQATRSVGVEQDATAAAAARQRAPAAQVCHDEFFAWARRDLRPRPPLQATGGLAARTRRRVWASVSAVLRDGALAALDYPIRVES